nr:uncharacterized protein LOC119167879 [Rhipicephalus microplus]
MVLEIPYQDPSKTMVVFLPSMERLATFEHSLTPAKLLRCLANLQEREVEVPLTSEPPSTTRPTPATTRATPEPVRFTVDRPFMFLVMNKDPDAVLVLGSVKRVSSRKTKVPPIN